MCTVQSSFEPFLVPVRRVQDKSMCKLGATAVYEVAHEVVYIVVYYASFTILSWEPALTRNLLLKNAWCLSHARDEHHHSASWLLVSASCVIRHAESCLLKASDLGGLSAQLRIHYHSVIWYIVYPAKFETGQVLPQAPELGTHSVHHSQALLGRTMSRSLRSA